MQLCIPAITVEIGNPKVFQKRFVKNALIGITNIISSLRMIADDHALPEYQPVICDRSFWIFTTRGGLLNVIPEVNTWVRKGEVIATIHSIFGQLIELYKAPEDSIVIGKETDPVASSGARIVHIGVLTGSFAPGKVCLLLGIFADFQVDDGHL
jgi:predicted deacylase